MRWNISVELDRRGPWVIEWVYSLLLVGFGVQTLKKKKNMEIIFLEKLCLAPYFKSPCDSALYISSLV